MHSGGITRNLNLSRESLRKDIHALVQATLDGLCRDNIIFISTGRIHFSIFTNHILVYVIYLYATMNIIMQEFCDRLNKDLYSKRKKKPIYCNT